MAEKNSRPDGYLIIRQDHLFHQCPACGNMQPFFVKVGEGATTMGCCRCQRVIRQIYHQHQYERTP